MATLCGHLWRQLGVAVVLACLGLPALGQETMPSSRSEAEQLEMQNSLPLPAFYDAAPVASSKPGALLRHFRFDGYDLLPGVDTTRFLYHSRDGADHDVASSGVILVPSGSAPSGGWPVIAWAHRSSGVARTCAPSAMRDLYDGDLLLQMLKAGFAVVAIDYHGLGTVGPHEYMNTLAEARDVVYAIPAAQQAVPDLGKKWVVDGHSQGGQAAWGVAELEAERHDPGYLGAVSVAGTTYLPWSLAHPESLDSASGVYLTWLGYSIQARFPDFKPERMLSKAAMAHYYLTTEQGCWFTGYAVYKGKKPTEMLRAGWQSDPSVQQFTDETMIGNKPIAGGLLVIASEADKTVPLDGIKDSVNRACAHGQQLFFKTYAGLDHEPLMADSLADQLAWIKDRFAGKAAAGNCPATRG